MATESLVPPTPSGEGPVTIEEWLRLPEKLGAELIHHRIVYKALPDPAHGSAQLGLGALLFGPFNRTRGSADQPGGWWLASEVDLDLEGDGVRPDLCGWRRDRHAQRPRPGPKGAVTVAPDWVCEVLSPSTMDVDVEDKRVIYHRAGVGHYWLVDPERRSLTVLRHTPDGYLYALTAFRNHIVRAEPFREIDLSMRQVFPDD